MAHDLLLGHTSRNWARGEASSSLGAEITGARSPMAIVVTLGAVAALGALAFKITRQVPTPKRLGRMMMSRSPSGRIMMLPWDEHLASLRGDGGRRTKDERFGRETVKLPRESMRDLIYGRAA